MLLFDGQVHYDTHVVPMGNYVISFGEHQAVLLFFQTWALKPVRAGHVPVRHYPEYADHAKRLGQN